MKAYHLDLRQRIVDAYQKAEGSVRELAARFKVAPRTVQNYLNLKRETGSVSTAMKMEAPGVCSDHVP